MADDEKNEETEDEVAPAGDDAAADAPAEEAPAEEPTAEEAPAEEPAAEEPAAEEDADAPDAGSEPEAAPEPAAEKGSDPTSAEDTEPPLTQKALRKLERSKHAGEAKAPRSTEERIAERAEERKKAAANRRRYRASQRQSEGEPGQGTPPAEHEPGAKKVRQGRVVSAKADKTITVRIDVARRHPQYEKVVRRSATLHAHDAQNDASEGDTVRVVETRPLSRTKRWRLVEVVERAR